MCMHMCVCVCVCVCVCMYVCVHVCVYLFLLVCVSMHVTVVSCDYLTIRPSTHRTRAQLISVSCHYSTEMNAESSRSHLVIGIVLESTNKATGNVVKGKVGQGGRWPAKVEKLVSVLNSVTYNQ